MTTSPNDNLAEILIPVFKAESAKDLRQAVTDVAEALAVLGAQILDRSGRPVHGVTDERAVIGTLATYARTLARYGLLDDANAVAELMERVQNLPTPKPRRGI